MRKILSVLTVLFIASALAVVCFAAETKTLASPSGNVVLTCEVTDAGALYYSVTCDGKTVVERSAIGMIGVTAGDFSSGLTLIGEETAVIDESLPMVSGPYATLEDHANELTLIFSKGGYTYRVIFRVYDDGAAFRFCLDGTGTTRIASETTAFTLPEHTEVWGMDTELTNNAYSTVYTHKNIDSLTATQHMPMLLKTPDGVWGLITEADLYASGYPGSALTSVGNFSLGLRYEAYQTNNGVTSSTVATLPFTSPWRVIVCGDLATLAETQIVDALATRADGDWSWVEPGLTAWSWNFYGTSRQDEVELIKQHIDLASEMKWEYFLLDEGWQPHSANYTYDSRTYDGFYDWLPEIVEYADSKNVKLIAWLNRRAVDEPSELKLLEEIKAAGIAGVKVDFFDSESSTIITYYNRILQKCAELGLVVNLHGTNKPTGERMTYPNLISKEAIHGDEAKKTTPAYTTMFTFTRAQIGSADFTPAVYPFPKSTVTVGQQAALLLQLECGMATMAGALEDYYYTPLYWFYYDFPGRWDDYRFLDGYPEEYSVFARRSGENWYVGGLTDDVRTVELSLDFLGEGDYIAAIWQDNDAKDNVYVTYRTVRRGEVLTLPLCKGGGFAAKIIPAADAAPRSITLTGGSIVGVGETLLLSPVISPERCAMPDLLWTSSDASVATVANGRVVGKKAGIVTIRATSAADGSVYAEQRIYVFGGAIPAENWTVTGLSEQSWRNPILYQNDPYKISMNVYPGEIGRYDNIENLWMTDAPEGDFEAVIRVSGALTNNYQSVSLGLYADSDSVVQIARRFHSGLGAKAGSPTNKVGKIGNVVDFYTFTTKYTEKYVADPNYADDIWLKLVRRGNTFYGYTSYDGVEFTQIPGSITNAEVTNCENLKLIVGCACGSSLPFMETVTVSDLTVNGEKIPFATILPNGDVNKDGKFSLLDVLSTLKKAASGEPVDLRVYDINGDGAVGLSDALLLLKFLLN